MLRQAQHDVFFDLFFSPMKKRLRKKLRLREFQEMGFHTGFDLNIPAAREAEVIFWDKLFAFADAQELSIGGGVNSFYATRVGRGTATDADREALEGVRELGWR